MERAELIRRLLSRRQVGSNPAGPRSLDGRCWNWTGGKQSGDDYGRIWIDGRALYTHRVSAHVWLGMPLDSPYFVRHRCIGNQACFQPLHLRVGTQADNNRDIVAQGRHSNYRLTDTDIARLVGSVRSGKLTIGKWAHLSGVAYCTAYRAYIGTTHTEAVTKAHARWDKRRENVNANPITNAPIVEPLELRPGCAFRPSGLILVDAKAAGIASDERLYGPADVAPF